MAQEPEGDACQPAAAIDACCRFAGGGFSSAASLFLPFAIFLAPADFRWGFFSFGSKTSSGRSKLVNL
jgi:hypothetical protein